MEIVPKLEQKANTSKRNDSKREYEEHVTKNIKANHKNFFKYFKTDKPPHGGSWVVQ